MKTAAASSLAPAWARSSPASTSRQIAIRSTGFTPPTGVTPLADPAPTDIAERREPTRRLGIDGRRRHRRRAAGRHRQRAPQAGYGVAGRVLIGGRQAAPLARVDGQIVALGRRGVDDLPLAVAAGVEGRPSQLLRADTSTRRRPAPARRPGSRARGRRPAHRRTAESPPPRPPCSPAVIPSSPPPRRPAGGRSAARGSSRRTAARHDWLPRDRRAPRRDRQRRSRPTRRRRSGPRPAGAATPGSRRRTRSHRRRAGRRRSYGAGGSYGRCGS